MLFTSGGVHCSVFLQHPGGGFINISLPYSATAGVSHNVTCCELVSELIYLHDIREANPYSFIQNDRSLEINLHVGLVNAELY